MIKMTKLWKMMIVSAALASCGQAIAQSPASWRPRERWRGFNLAGKAIKGSFSGKWLESDLRMMREFGFNFARIPIDYRYWCRDDDWTKPDPAKFPPIDEMIAWGKKHRIHIQICFCTAPGMQLKPRSKKPLFLDPSVQDVVAANWAYFARRYRGIPNDELSFNLFNEPDTFGTEETYLPLVKKLVNAIHAEDPQRFIVIDGLEWAGKPLLGAIGLPVGQSLHAYVPRGVSHYEAGWLKRSSWPKPIWPPSPALSPICGSYKPANCIPVVIENVKKGRLTVDTGLFNYRAEFIIEADGRKLFSRLCIPSPDNPAWTNLVKRAGKNRWAGKLVEPICVDVPDCRKLVLRVGDGDWVEVNSLTLSSGGKTAVLPFNYEWGISARRDLRFAGFDGPHQFILADGSLYSGEKYLDDMTWKNWKPVLDAGQFMMVGETGCYNKTPHDVAMRWLEDNLRNWKERGIGWALWNFRGSMGILDSGRKDVKYEDYQGHKLDRKMLELLQRY